MISSEFKQYFAELRGEIEKLPRREPMGDMLARAFEIPLEWPEVEYPKDRTPIEQFKAALELWKGSVHVVGSEREVVPTVARIVEESEAKRLMQWHCPRLAGFDFNAGLAHLGIEWIDVTQQEVESARDAAARRKLIDRLEKVEIGITDADYAVAHTGTLLFEHSEERCGFTNLFPWTHIAIVRASQLLGSIQDSIDRMAEERRDSPWRPNTIFITGPSRSGDIDLTHGQGAAGPGRLHVVLIEGE